MPLQMRKKSNILLVKWIATILRPFSILEDDAFGEFACSLNQSYTLPTSNLLSQMAAETKQNIINAVSQLDNMKHIPLISLELDFWSSITSDSFLI